MGQDEGQPAVAAELRLRIGAGEPLRGELRVQGDDTAVTFDGWLELIAAINAARAGGSDP